MSQWTHINGNIRIDVIPEVSDDLPIMKERLGKIARWRDSRKVWDQCKLPMGSEGSIYYEINSHKVGDFQTFSSVSFTGDLRDFGSSKQIRGVKKWFKDLLEGFDVRQAILEIDIEYQDTIILLYYNDKIKEIKITTKKKY